MQSKKKLAAETYWESYFLSNDEKVKCIEDYGERETAGARKRVQDAEAAVLQEQEDMKRAENEGLRNREPDMTFQGTIVGIADSLSDLASSDDGEDGEDDDDRETEQNKLSDDDQPGCVMSTISNMPQQRIERFRQNLVKLDEFTHPGWGDTADYFHQRDKKYAISELRVPAAIKP